MEKSVGLTGSIWVIWDKSYLTASPVQLWIVHIGKLESYMPLALFKFNFLILLVCLDALENVFRFDGMGFASL